MRKQFLTFLIALAVTVGAALAPLPAAYSAGFLLLVKPGGTAWTPASLGSNLIAWYKADAGLTCTGGCTTGNPVTNWADQSGNSNNLVKIVGSNDSTFHSTGLGGKQSVGFVTSGGMQTAPTDTMTNMGTGNTASCFVLASVTTSGGNDALGYSAAGQAASSGANSGNFFDLAATPSFSWGHAFATGTVQALTASTETRIGVIFDGVHATPYLNNVAGTQDALNFSWASPGTLKIGNGAGGWDGEIREVVCTNTALSSGDRASLDAYLVSRQ